MRGRGLGVVAVFGGRRRRGNPVNGAEGIQEARDFNLKREPKGTSNDQKKPSEKAGEWRGTEDQGRQNTLGNTQSRPRFLYRCR